MTENLIEAILIGVILLLIGLTGIILNTKNLLIMLMSIELLLLAVNLLFLSFSLFLDDSFGLLFTLFLLGVAGSESAIGLAILVSYFRSKGSLSLWSRGIE